ncbi:MAG: hypothetical protein ACREOI_02565 [bacterium]
MKITREILDSLAQSIVATRPEEIDCDEWLSRVGRLLEIMQRGEPVPSELAPVLQHIELCSECDEELQLLLAALNDTD